MGVWRRNRGFYRAIVKSFFPVCGLTMRNKRGLIAGLFEIGLAIFSYSMLQLSPICGSRHSKVGQVCAALRIVTLVDSL